MSTFLPFASKVEAAVEAYITVRDFSDEMEWRAGLKKEFVSSHMRGVLHGVSIDLCLK